ncbi:UDP-glucosyltransferase 2-like [Toxorhynchites rutilus septentrionalis]|uniref:UDP-glucosyltransferase 2-like n=1 Tax=Toxorhynchites rutilus septentrionalis TaxID=329112 RepID=UPI002479D47D|nr:UDP-glucosyltransferase 2-like [Toxorhynchites rutilus septentrionalis]
MRILETTLIPFSIVFMILAHCDGAKILFVTSFPVKSHWLLFQHIIGELINRGHEITAITNYKLDVIVDKNRYREVLIHPTFEFKDDHMQSYFHSDSFQHPVYNIVVLRWLGLATTEHALHSDNVKQFLKQNELKYDLIIAEQFVQEAFLMFGHKYNAPIVTINTLGYTDYIDGLFGMMTPLSFVPHHFVSMNDDMNYRERLYNFFLAAYDWSHRWFDYISEQDALAREFFADNKYDRAKLPSVQELELNISVVLSNNHIVFTEPRPKMAGMVDIAGAHIRKPKKLPSSIKQFLNSSSDGVIYINFGTFLRSTALPQITVEAFLRTFRNLPQYNFLWKWDGAPISDLPENVHLDNWLPQNDVLAHPKIKLFINHGGIFGAQEAINWAKPMLIVPIYGDQHRNAFKLQQAGVAITLAKDNITSDSLLETILQIVNNTSFQQNVNHLSGLFRDNPTDPLEEAVFWIEYVIRHRGAAHLKSAAIKVSWYQYLLLDVFVLIFLFIFACFYMLSWSIKQIIKANEHRKLMIKKNQ